MPRIEAATVVQHHHMRRTALIDAGRELLLGSGFDAVTPAAVGAIAGIARSSVYQYFPSTASLLLAIIDDAFPAATARVTDAVAGIEDPKARIDAYVGAAFDFAVGPEHRLFDALGGDRLPAEVKERLEALHRQQYVPLIEALARLGVPNVGLVTQLIGGLVQSAVRAAKSGADPELARATLIASVHAGPIAASVRP